MDKNVKDVLYRFLSLQEKLKEIDKCVKKWRKIYNNDIVEMNRRVLCVRYIVQTKPSLSEEDVEKLDEIIKGLPVTYYVFLNMNEFIIENLTTNEVSQLLRKINKIVPITYLSITTPNDYWISTDFRKPVARTLEIGKRKEQIGVKQ